MNNFKGKNVADEICKILNGENETIRQKITTEADMEMAEKEKWNLSPSVYMVTYKPEDVRSIDVINQELTAKYSQLKELI